MDSGYQKAQFDFKKCKCYSRLICISLLALPGTCYISEFQSLFAIDSVGRICKVQSWISCWAVDQDRIRVELHVLAATGIHRLRVLPSSYHSPMKKWGLGYRIKCSWLSGCKYCVPYRDRSIMTTSSKAKGLNIKVWFDRGVNRGSSLAGST